MSRRLLAAAILIGALAGRAAAQGAAPAPAAAAAQPQGGAKPKKKTAAPKAKKKKKAAADSKYKTHALAESMQSSYHFDKDGNPVGAASKPAAKARKSSEPAEKKGACTDEAPCTNGKSSDADAL
jgi:hypothetical protein